MFVLFLKILRFVFRFRLQVSVIQSCSQSTNKVLHALQQNFPAASKTQLRNKVREILDFVDTHWQIYWSNVITEHSQAILNSLYSFYWNLTRNWELRTGLINVGCSGNSQR
ncbi:hypothetical protein RchiOBHm_Chr5g0011851 [Rosa chinensis]|uniref:Chromatin assembly factor 1 subunit Cac1-like C-terminal domain-containing protein n=1 Tax=Rosa chinensis TaxID=74649 RepID=A0A2P6Q4Z7_ROSCH|nr:uncharacterized protein LOC112202311 isoform X3 [Rosa chinensis]PRQ29246.1 hypothetical protein RchiOBHm_Chr5g0011851 [Rosa chinensis]